MTTAEKRSNNGMQLTALRAAADAERWATTPSFLKASMADDQNDNRILDFIIRQYEDHRQCLLTVVQEERQMERYVLLGCAGFYSWLATQSASAKGFIVVASFVPTGIVILSTMRVHALVNGVRTEASYLRQLEVEIYKYAPKGYSGPLGWERFINADGNYGKKYELSQLVFWYSLSGLTVFAGIAFLILRA